MTKYQVTGELADVTALLMEGLDVQELAALRIEPGPTADPFAPQPRRGEPVGTTTVLIWIGGAVASGIAYDAIKVLSIKVWELLKAHYGEDKVRKDESDR